MTTVATIKIDYRTVTPEMIGAAHKVFGPDNRPFYKVENSRGDVDEQGSIVEYSVKAIFRNGKWHITCDCEAGKEGRLCWHKRAAQAAAAEEKQAMAEQVALNEAAKQVKPVAAVKPQATKKIRKVDEGALLHQSRMRGIADIL